MSSDNVLRFIAGILVAGAITALFVLLRYWSIKKTLDSKPGAKSYSLYIWILIKFLALIGCIYALWTLRFADVWAFLSLAYICWSLIILLFVFHKIRVWKIKGRG
jgi:membrane-associated HD superfamily phosphohydrolase